MALRGGAGGSLTFVEGWTLLAQLLMVSVVLAGRGPGLDMNVVAAGRRGTEYQQRGSFRS